MVPLGDAREAVLAAAGLAGALALACAPLRVAVRCRYGPGGIEASWELRLGPGLAVGRRWHLPQERLRRPPRALLAELVRRVPAARAGQALLARARVERLGWHSRLGLGDAALTALASGFLWAAKGAWVSQLAARHGPLLAPPDLRVEPVFDRWYWESSYACIYRLRLWDLMVAAPAAWRALRRPPRPGVCSPAGRRDRAWPIPSRP